MTPDDSSALARRISDADRENAAVVLNRAVADGRLTWPEHAERLELVYAARTAADLSPVLADLHLPASVDRTPKRLSAVFSKVLRAPEGASPLHVRAVFGTAVLDLRSAAPGEEVELRLSSLFGKIELTVAEDAVVLDEGGAVFGKRRIPGRPAGTPGAVIRLSGRNVFGKLTVRRA
ncbi:DUF1707 domain-containing protein [Allokutzneria sp. NRRL B-24872]|uniref:DUF1707 SHOCT-like domain-containing protein n=1 Tax=Allokutzneria sp. NRRL B-24872 TaxID=1137961 RepID=UPI000A3CCE61|nr:DUF1707 domain-containing protein [Allokutzneria sp. NRRL B-24872]